MPGYRPPSTEPRGKWAKRIHEKRRAEGISQTGAFELLGPKLGFGPKSRFSYTALDMGTREPNEHEAAVLAEWLGGYPSDAPEPTTATETPDPTSALISAMTAALIAQMQALGDLRADVAEARAAAQSERKAMMRVIARLEARLAELPPLGDRTSAAADQASART